MTLEPTAYDATYQAAGEQCSSTSEGRYVTFIESVLTHPANASGLVEKGMPCVTFELCGVAMTSASAATDRVSLDTEGIWWLDVYAWFFGVDITVGQRVYIDPITAVVSDDITGMPFGWALCGVNSEQTELIAVKVHSTEWLFWVFWFFFQEEFPK